MPYQVINIQKLKCRVAITSTSNHNLRTHLSENVGQSRLSHNEFFIGSPTMDFNGLFKEKLETLTTKPKKDSVTCLNLIFGASAEFFIENDQAVAEWKQRTLEFVENKFGRDNILYAVCHNDEMTPHIHFAVVPIINGKLNCKGHINGPAGLRAFHTEYNNQVKSLGLTRGRERSVRKSGHGELVDFYQRVNVSAADLEKGMAKAEAITQLVDNVSVFNYKSILGGLKPKIMDMVKYTRTLKDKVVEYKSKYEISEAINKAQSERLLRLRKKFQLLGLNDEPSDESLAELMTVLKRNRYQQVEISRLKLRLGIDSTAVPEVVVEPVTVAEVQQSLRPIKRKMR